jgi:hypothetical protein
MDNIIWLPKIRVSGFRLRSASGKKSVVNTKGMKVEKLDFQILGKKTEHHLGPNTNSSLPNQNDPNAAFL